MEFWFDGPDRDRADCDDYTRQLLAEMQRTAIEHFLPRLDDADEQPLVPDLGDRLGEVDVPTLVVIGDHDVTDIAVMADRIVGEISGAGLGVIAGTAHLPSLEAPEQFNAMLADFLRRNRSVRRRR